MERQQSQRDRSLAWFKLADLISRGEREKALNVFRLLAHSLSDRAYVLQLEGDILWYLDDKGAAEKYKQAAFLYQKDKRWVDSVSVYEHLLTQEPDSYEIISSLLVFYMLLDWPEKFQERYKSLIQLYSNNILDDMQLEKTLKDVIDSARAVDDPESKKWLFSYFLLVFDELSGNVGTRLSGLL
jgi:tetratricopeptide (TPR) repeat protein